MRGASAGKTMYVIPYLMAPPGSPLEPYAVGIELTDHRTVALHMIRMARCGVEYVNDLADPDKFVRGVHVTGDLENLGQGTPDDKRYFVTIADERTILHFGSSYGGNALLGKIAHGLRQASYDGWASGEFLSEQFMLIGITDKQTGHTWHICGGFPSASGKTNLAMMLPPDSLGDRYHVEFYGDDIAWLRVDPDGRQDLRDQSRVRRLRCGQGHQRGDQPDGARLGRARHQGAVHERRLQRRHPRRVVGGTYAEAARGRHRLAGLDRPAHRRALGRRGGQALGAPEQPVHHLAAQGAQHRGGLREPQGRADRRDHLRRSDQRPRAADPGDHRPRRGRLRRAHPRRRGHVRGRGRGRPAALRPDVDAAVHVLPRGRIRGALAQDHRRRGRSADLRARQLVPASTRRTSTSSGPATGRTCGRCCGCCSSRTARCQGRPTAVGIVPTKAELDLDGMEISAADLDGS